MWSFGPLLQSPAKDEASELQLVLLSCLALVQGLSYGLLVWELSFLKGI